MESRPTCTFVWCGTGWLIPDQAYEMIAAYHRGKMPDLMIRYIDIDGNLLGTSDDPKVPVPQQGEELNGN